MKIKKVTIYKTLELRFQPYKFTSKVFNCKTFIKSSHYIKM